MIRRHDVWPLGALGFILAVTVAWWSFALWAVPGAPDWVERARSVCFNITTSGLPDAKGWLLLLGQPPVMLSLLLVGWRHEVGGSLRRLLSSGHGRAAAGLVFVGATVGLGLVGAKVAQARLPAVAWGTAAPASAAYMRLDRPWPGVTDLVDQTGDAFTLERIRGAPALVTFAFGHCETLCPVVVHQALSARAELERSDTSHGERGSGPQVSLVVFTLDPWRDTPSRLGGLLARWGLDPARDFVVGGSVEAVEGALDAWEIARRRDERTGDVVHAGVIYLIEPDGTLAFSSSGGVEHIVSLGERLRKAPLP